MKTFLGILGGIVIGALGVSALSQVAPDEDPFNISPELYSVRFENDRVRVLEYRNPTGGIEAMHSHPPGVVIYLGDASSRTTLPDGTSSVGSRKQGDVVWRDFTRHASENIGVTEVHAIAIELKSAAR
jgi:hypothetical protein